MSTRYLKGGKALHPISQMDERLRTAFEKCLLPLEGCHYAYFLTSKAREVEPRIFSNYPEHWLDVYKTEGYHLIDPVIRHGMKCIAPFFWHEALESKDSGMGREVFASSEKYRISDGFTFNLHDAHGLFAALSISNTERRHDFEQFMTGNAAEIQMTLVQFQSRLTNCFSLNELFPDLDETGLSDRELSVLKWVVMGKAYREIAAICAISIRTVKFHMANVVNKLQVCNAKQAVYKAVSLGLV
ncbi:MULTISPECIES: helix-turn-helix transcriptional regulator [unclassified Pseudomonas]|uniref:helix-turn-helix transcriptional regulator n=1 Tax=Pseudomonas sp. Ant30-3 TaxID=1488328 RepID=UPI001F3B7FDB|nr:LuxR family transcriptional regulator [Pseudomonas sp. Ant30-3]